MKQSDWIANIDLMVLGTRVEYPNCYFPYMYDQTNKGGEKGGGPNQTNMVHLVYTFFVLNIKVFSFASIRDFDTWTDTIRKVSRLLHLFHSVYLRRQ